MANGITTGLGQGLATGIGLAESARSNRANEQLAGRKLALGEGQLRLEEEESQRKLIADQINANVDFLVKAKESFGGTTEEFMNDPRVLPRLEELVFIAQATDNAGLGRTALNQVELSPTASELAASEAQAGVTGAQTTAEGLSGASPEVLRAAEAQGLTKAVDRDLVNLRGKNGEVLTFVVNTDEDQRMLDTLLRSGEFVKTTAQETGRFSMFQDPVSKRFWVLDTQTQQVRPLRPEELGQEELPKAVVPQPETGAQTPASAESGVVSDVAARDQAHAELDKALPRGGDIISPDIGGGREAKEEERVPIILSLENIGAPGVLANFLSDTVGQFTALDFPKQAAEKQRLNLLKTDIRLALTLSGRPPLFEQQQLIALVPDPGQFLANPDSARSKVGELALKIKAQIRSDVAVFTDRNQTPKAKKESLNRITKLKDILDTIGPVASSQDEVNAFPSGTVFMWYDPSTGEGQLVRKDL